ncbi:MAG: MotA/TolQ/ExbB proton channel family protein [FCB group bacterium]
MKTSTLIGILFGSLAIFGAFIWQGGSVNALFMLPAMLIVFGGTFAAALAGSSAKQVSLIPKLIGIAIRPPQYDTKEIIYQIVEFSTVARREGILALDAKLQNVKHPFLKKMFEICIDGAEPDTLLKIVETEMGYISDRHLSNISLFVKMGGYSPTMGIIGTVMGLIATLAAAGSEPNVLIHHIASAFIATMWGIFMANVVWLPLGDKLRTLHNEEMQLLQVMLDGAYATQLGEMPSVIRVKLISVFPLKMQEELLKGFKSRSAIIPQPIEEVETEYYYSE